MIPTGSAKNIILLLFFLLGQMIVVSPLPAVAGRQAKPITRMQLEEVTDLLMSPGCRYTYTLTRCPSAEAEQMRKMVRDRLAAGESKEQILDYFASVYGPRVLAQPAKKGFYFLAWWFPYFLLADALLLVGIILFFWHKKANDSQLSSNDREASGLAEKEMQDLLEQEVKNFREE